MTLNTLTYQGYTARIDFDAEDKLFFGRVLGIGEMISFHGETVAELTSDFQSAIKHYLADCEKTGRQPDMPDRLISKRDTV